MRLLIAIPVYNERKYVAHVLDKVRRFHSDILVVDDASNDGTDGILASRSDINLLRHAHNRGYGRSLIDAFHYAGSRGYDWVLTMDCDEQHEPEAIPQFVRLIGSGQWDIISGSRYLHHRSDDDLPPTDRRSINATITDLLNGLFNLHLTDSFCGFKAHRVSTLRSLSLDEEGYAFPMQFWPQVVRAGLRITETPVRLIYKDPTRHFGGALDDADNRLQHYLSVLADEVMRPKNSPVFDSEQVACCCNCY